jgi:pimeloyl-ACP methyl ester carboxylesterase
MNAQRRVEVALGDGAMAGWAWGDPERPVDIVFFHANGFNAYTYRSILAPLGERLHVAAFDLRGHGRTRLPAEPNRQRSWNVFRDDICALMDRFAPGGAILAGHSMGGTSALLAAGERPDLVKRLVLVDPVLQPKEFYWYASAPWAFWLWRGQFPLAKAARRRREWFESRSQALEAYTGRGAFRSWRAPFLEDYLADGLIEDGEGLRLSCAPLFEASCFAGQQHDPWKAMKKARRPTHILRAAKGSTCDLEAADYAERMLLAKVQTAPGATHFIPMERPYMVADALRAAAIAQDPYAGLLD